MTFGRRVQGAKPFVQKVVVCSNEIITNSKSLFSDVSSETTYFRVRESEFLPAERIRRIVII